MRLEQYFVPTDLSLTSAIQRLSQDATQILLVVAPDRKLLGTVTDGDIRRAILRQVEQTSFVSDVMNSQPLTAAPDWSPQQAQSIMRARRIHHIPIVDSAGCVSGIFTEQSLVNQEPLPNTAVLMVGGLGKRLGSLTKDCPKPMLPIGGKPIMEITIETLRDAGFRHFVLAVNYLAHMIEDHFGDGARYGVEIDYVWEEEPLGTAGALRLVTPRPDHPVLVMNGDILTRVNFGHLLRYHEESGASATMCVREFTQQIPFGVVEVEGQEITGIQEKPTSKCFINSGIYVIDPHALHFLSGGRMDMPELFTILREQQKPTIAYPIQEYWTDIGRVEDLNQAKTEFPLYLSTGEVH